ncbi:MAG: hypothetical protein VW709_18880, partial [Rickettsiales bacterium]
LLALAAVLRLALHYTISSTIPGRTRPTPWLVPLRDLLSPIIRLACYFGTTVTWRERDFVIQSDMRFKPAE